MSPLHFDDLRLVQLPHVDMTLADDPRLLDGTAKSNDLMGRKAPTKLGVWHCKVLWIARKVGVHFATRILFRLRNRRQGGLTDLGRQAIWPSCRSVPFHGHRHGSSRANLKEVKRINTPIKRERRKQVCSASSLFSSGKVESRKDTKSGEGKVENLHQASVAEVCFTDTFETTDNKYRYGQVFVDYRSRYGDVFPIRSRKKVGWAFGEFCCRQFVPLILIRDNISENIGGALMEECHRRGVKSAFSCPYTPQQNYSEGYLGRITTMASFAMVLSGAPVFMWRWAILCASFINNIMVTYCKKEEIWATPWEEVMHGEVFPDSSIVVPFGCAALIKLTEDEREKFRTTCAMIIFIHYALDHPLYTYALYSPRSKKVLFRQDCIFLPGTFPMREARTRVGLMPDGEILLTYRAPQVPEVLKQKESSFGEWKEEDPLPPYNDHVTGYTLVSLPDETSLPSPERPVDWPRHRPSHPAFGAPSVVMVPRPWKNNGG